MAFDGVLDAELEGVAVGEVVELFDALDFSTEEALAGLVGIIEYYLAEVDDEMGDVLREEVLNALDRRP